MIMHYLYYITGVFLLVFPAGLLSRSQLRVISLPELTDRARHHFGWVHWINLLDLLRAWAGLHLVRHAFRMIDPGAAGSMLAVATTAVAALAGLGLQQVFYSADEDDLVAPVAYAIGLTMAFIPPLVALLVLPIGLLAAIGMRSLGSGFVLAAAATAGIGLLLRLPTLVVATTSLVLFAPALLAAVFQRRLVLTVRNRKEPRGEPLREIPIQTSR
jgi:hypothetical protein